MFTAIGVYLECDAVSMLAEKWKGKAAEELAGSVEFFKDIWAGNVNSSLLNLRCFWQSFFFLAPFSYYKRYVSYSKLSL